MNPELKNSLLQRTSFINPRLLNRCIDKAFYKQSHDAHDKEPPFLRLCSEQPSIPVRNCDVVRRREAFGEWALPKLYKELYCENKIVALQALSSVLDLVHDPERVYEAIYLKFVPRLGNLLMRTNHLTYQERILLILKTMVSHEVGRTELINRLNILNKMKTFITAKDANINCKTAAFFEMLSRSFSACCVLIEQEFIPIFVSCLVCKTPDTIKYHLRTLEKLFFHTSGQEAGIQCRAINRLVFLLGDDDLEIRSLAGNALALLISHPDGKVISVDMELLEILDKLLYHEDRDVHTSACEVLMFATHKVEAKHQAAAISNLPERLINLAKDFHSPALQMFAIKALGNICEHPAIRKLVLEKYMCDILNINTCCSRQVEEFKRILIKIIEWKPWIG